MRIKLLKDGIMPLQGTKNAAGYDLFAIEDGVVYIDSYQKVPIGVCMEIPLGIVGTISHRSGLNSKQGIQAFGQVDCDYRGEISVTLFNAGRKAFRYKKGDRIAQIAFVQIWNPCLELSDTLSETKRGGGGHGSTGT